MKRSRLSYDEWKCILSKEHNIKYINTESFKGYIGQIDILDVTSPQIWKFKGDDIVVCQKGYKWISILPSDEYYSITAMMNGENKILLWYIDMIAGQGIDIDYIPYFDDLYLDLIVYPDGSVFEDDRDELEEALSDGNITFEQYELANYTCNKLKDGLLADIETFVTFTYLCKELLSK